jgi:hypothetical protein
VTLKDDIDAAMQFYFSTCWKSGNVAMVRIRQTLGLKVRIDLSSLEKQDEDLVTHAKAQEQETPAMTGIWVSSIMGVIKDRLTRKTESRERAEEHARARAVLLGTAPADYFGSGEEAAASATAVDHSGDDYGHLVPPGQEAAEEAARLDGAVPKSDNAEDNLAFKRKFSDDPERRYPIPDGESGAAFSPTDGRKTTAKQSRSRKVKKPSRSSASTETKTSEWAGHPAMDPASAGPRGPMTTGTAPRHGLKEAMKGVRW